MKKFKIFHRGIVKAVFAAESKEDAMRKVVRLYDSADDMTVEETNARSPIYTTGIRS